MRFECLQAFRGFAILWIVLHHYLDNHQGYGKLIFSFFQRGYQGVTIFFVIAGYAISTAAERALSQNESARSFLLKRIQRIYIPYLFSLLFAALIFPGLAAVLSALKSGLSWPHLAKYAQQYFYDYSFAEWVGILSLTKVFTSTSGQLNKAFLPMNGALWFLAVLIQMYLAIALALSTRKHYFKVILALTALSLIALIPAVKNSIPYGFFLPYWPEFAAGIGLYTLVQRGKIFQVRAEWYFPVLILYTTFTISMLILSDSPVLFSALLAGLFWLLFPQDKRISRWPLFRFFAWIGVFSYSLYLIHVPLEPLLLMVIRNVLPLSYYITDLFVEVPAAILLGYVWYLFFERRRIEAVKN